MESKYIQGDVLIHPLWSEGFEVARVIYDDEVEAYFYIFRNHGGTYAEKDLIIQIPRPEPKFLVMDYVIYSQNNKNKGMACEVIDMYFQDGTWWYEVMGIVAETVKESWLTRAEEYQIPKFPINTPATYRGKQVRVSDYLPLFFYRIELSGDRYIVHQNDLEEYVKNGL